MLASKLHNNHHFGFRNFISEDPTFANTVLMYMQHDPMRRLVILVEETLEDMDDEVHRRVVVVEQ